MRPDPGRLALLVPMKSLAEAKSRLRDSLDPLARAALCLMMLQRVLSATRGIRDLTPCPLSVDGEGVDRRGRDGGEVPCPSIRARYVIGGDEAVRRVAKAEGAAWLRDTAGDLNGAVAVGAATAWDGAADAVLVLPGDLPLVAPEDVAALIGASRGLRRAAISAAARDGGTNALLTPRGMLVGPHFGPGSFQRHLAAMRAAKVPVEVVDRPGLAFDLDTDADLERLRAMEPRLEAALEPWRRMVAEDAATARRLS